MKRIALILIMAATAAAMLASCCPCRRTVKIVLVPERILLPAEAVLTRDASDPESRPFKYANPRTHRDSLLLGLEQASREAARFTNEKYGLTKNR